MKMTTLIYGLVLFAVINFGFTSDVKTDKLKINQCTYLQQMSGKGDCPYLNSLKSDCPYLKGENQESESGSCPYTGKGKTNKSNSNTKVKLLELKIS